MNTHQSKPCECPCLHGLASELRKINETVERMLDRMDRSADPLGDIGLAEVAPADRGG